jgi:hypothetical protein
MWIWWDHLRFNGLIWDKKKRIAVVDEGTGTVCLGFPPSPCRCSRGMRLEGEKKRYCLWWTASDKAYSQSFARREEEHTTQRIACWRSKTASPGIAIKPQRQCKKPHTHGISQKKAKCPMPLVAPKTSLKAASTSFPFAETGEAGSSTTCHTERNGHARHTAYAALTTLKKQHLHTLAQLQTLEDRRRGDNRPRFR